MATPITTGILPLERCPHCGIAMPLMAGAARFPTIGQLASNRRWWVAFACSSCGGPVLAYANDQDGPIIDHFPRSQVVSDDIPERARTYLSQATASFHAPSGAIMLAASSVDAMLKARGLREGSLYARIEKAAEQHLITEEMKAWAHEVRLDANEQRHSDDEAPLPTAEDAKHTVEFARALATILFELPARVLRGRGKKG